MPLKDHFHPPLSVVRHWESFHARWAGVIADQLEGRLLPPGYFAEVHVHVGSRIEVDIAAFEDDSLSEEMREHESSRETATATLKPHVWTPPAPTLVMPAEFPDRLELLIFNSDAGPTLVAAIELVSPRNKDREQSRRAFAIKCASYLNQGIGLVVVDIVTNRRANLHNEMMQLLQLPESYLFDAASLYAVAYRPIERGEQEQIEIWHDMLAVDESLPVLPLPLDKGQCLPLDLESSYEEATQRMRMP